MQGIGRELAERIVLERQQARFTDINDVVRRAGLTVAQAEALATLLELSDCFDCLVARRSGTLDTPTTTKCSARPSTPPPVLPGMSEVELTLADLWATRISPDDHPVQHLRPVLDDHDVVPIDRPGAAYAERRVQWQGW